jgi:hypothetical protein
MNMYGIFCLIKFGRKEHLEALRDKGQVRFGLLANFQTSTEKERGDKFETAVNILNGQFTKVECNHPELGRHTFKVAANTLGTIIHFLNEPYYCFSSYALTSDCFGEYDTYVIDNKMLGFGDHALVIFEPVLFLDRIKRNLTDKKIEFGYKRTDYRNYKIEGDIDTNLFSKTDELSHQHEHRILIKMDSVDKAIFVEIGSIRDWCFLSSTDELIKTEFKARRHVG